MAGHLAGSASLFPGFMAYKFETVSGLIRVTFQGQLTAAELTEMVAELDHIEAGSPVSPDRLIDLSGVEGTAVGVPTMNHIAELRAKAPLRNNIRSALVARTDLQYGFARMFQLMSENPRIEIAVFRDVPSARGWLESK